MYHTPPLCFTQQNIGEVSHSDGGVKKNSDSNKIKSQPHPLPSPAALRGTTKQYKEKGCCAILLPCTPKK